MCRGSCDNGDGVCGLSLLHFDGGFNCHGAEGDGYFDNEDLVRHLPSYRMLPPERARLTSDVLSACLGQVKTGRWNTCLSDSFHTYC